MDITFGLGGVKYLKRRKDGLGIHFLDFRTLFARPAFLAKESFKLRTGDTVGSLSSQGFLTHPD